MAVFCLLPAFRGDRPETGIVAFVVQGKVRDDWLKISGIEVVSIPSFDGLKFVNRRIFRKRQRIQLQ